MSPASGPGTPSARGRLQRRRDLRAITADGVFFSLMVGLGESYVPAFALAVGLGDVVAGLLATVPMLLGGLMQLATPFAVRRLGSYRRWVVFSAAAQALSFTPLVVGAIAGRIGLGWIAAATVGFWAFGMSAGPAWNAWVTTLVPQRLRAVFFAQRTRAGQAALLIGLVGGGVALELGRARDLELAAFAALFTGALVARLVSSLCLAAQSERADLVRDHRTLGPGGVWRSLRGADSLRVLRYLLAMQVATHIAAPFFTPYMLTHLSLSYGEFMVLTATAFVARVAILPLLGRVARDHGSRRLLWIGGIGIIPMPMLWLVSDGFYYLLCVQLVSGCVWGAVELATTLSFFDGIEEADRASVLTAYNLANAMAIVIGSLIGAQLLGRLDPDLSLWFWLFTISSLGRVLAALLLRATPAKEEHVATDLQLRTLAVRPAGVLVQRPILASLEEDEEGEAREPGSDPAPV